MRAAIKILAISLGSALLAGCWQSKADFYAGQTPLTPFKPGPVTTTASDGKTSHSTLFLEGGAYRLVMGADAGFRLRFFPLAGGPPDMLIIEAELIKNCKAGACDPIGENGPHFFALAHLTPAGGAEELAANCDGDTANRLGAMEAGNSGICDFPDRTTLEKALRTLIGSKPVSIVNPD